MTFVFRFRRRGQLFWRKRSVVGYKFSEEMDRLTFYYADGGLEEVPEWSKYHARLGTDWVLAVKKKMDAEAGQVIPLNTK